MSDPSRRQRTPLDPWSWQIVCSDSGVCLAHTCPITRRPVDLVWHPDLEAWSCPVCETGVTLEMVAEADPSQRSATTG